MNSDNRIIYYFDGFKVHPFVVIRETDLLIVAEKIGHKEYAYRKHIRKSELNKLFNGCSIYTFDKDVLKTTLAARVMSFQSYINLLNDEAKQLGE